MIRALEGAIGGVRDVITVCEAVGETLGLREGTLLDMKVGVLHQTEDGTVDGDIVGPAVETRIQGWFCRRMCGWYIGWSTGG